MNAHAATDRGKAPYEKPRLRVIRLAGREVLGAGCKTDNPSFTPPNYGVLLGCGLAVPCFAAGT
jgi:hypothetical protein